VSASAVRRLGRARSAKWRTASRTRIVSLGLVWQLWRPWWFLFHLNSRAGSRAMRVPHVDYGWNPIETAP
jgi:hypothetical protein